MKLHSLPQTCVGFANICRCFMNYHMLPAAPSSCPSMKTTLKNSIPNLFKESSRFNSLRPLWPTGNLGLALPPSLDFCAFVASKQGNCTLAMHWTLQIISVTARGSPTIGTPRKFGGGKWLYSSRLSSACSLKITPFWWGSLDLLRSVLLFQPQNQNQLPVRIKPLKVFRDRALKAELHWFP